MSTLSQRSLYPLLLCSLVMILVIYVQLDNRARNSLSDSALLEWEDGGQTTQLWGDDEECQQYRTRFLLQNSLPARALVSYPGSGNTWTRYLVEAATGVFTGSIYHNEGIINEGLYGEAREYSDGSTLLQKTHHAMPQSKIFKLEWRLDHIRKFGGRAVLVVRNPYKAIISFYNFYQTGSQKKSVAAERLQSKDFHNFVRDGAERWLELIQDWLLFSTDLHVVMYEVSSEKLSQAIFPFCLIFRI